MFNHNLLLQQLQHQLQHQQQHQQHHLQQQQQHQQHQLQQQQQHQQQLQQHHQQQQHQQHHQQQQLQQHQQQLQQHHQQQLRQVVQHQHIPSGRALTPQPPAPQAPTSCYPRQHPHGHQGPRLVPAAAVAHGAPAPHLRTPGAPTPHLRPPGAPAPTSLMPPTLMAGAMLMQRMQSFSVPGGPRFSQFFMAGVRSSILRPPHHAAPPVAPVRGVRASFTPSSYPNSQTNSTSNYPHSQTNSTNSYPHSRTNSTNQDSAKRLAESKREGTEMTGQGTGAQGSASITEGKAGTPGQSEAAEKSGQTGCPQEERPHIKPNGGESGGSPPLEPSHQNAVSRTCSENPRDSLENDAMSPPSLQAEKCAEETRAAEVLGVGSSLKVTIQQTNESRAFSTGLEEPANHSQDSDQNSASSRFLCYICNTTCCNQQEFQSHMNSLQHQRRLMEIQHMSSTCLAQLLPSLTDHREKRPSLQRWCTTCQCHFSGDLVEHRRTKEHKMCKHSSRPFCTMCTRHFRTPRKFVEHMKSREHKQRVEELQEERGPELLDELITVDAVGCFEGEDNYEEESSEEEEEGVATEQSAHRSVALEDMRDEEEYDPDTQYGSSFVVPVAGFLCRLCHKFYHFESTALQSHCRSLTHFQNLQKYRRRRRRSQLPQEERQEEEEEEEEEEHQEEEEEVEAPGLHCSRAPPTHTQKHSALAAASRGKASRHKHPAKRSRTQTDTGPEPHAAGADQTGWVDAAKRSCVQLHGDDLSQDSGLQGSEMDIRGEGGGVHPRPCDPPDRAEVLCDLELELGRADREEAMDGLSETGLQQQDQQQQPSSSASGQRHSVSRRKSTRASKRP
ncbi:cdkn1a interacting zinc finger protein 1b isoform X2 [Alosa sapidissima]|uniref:cdkn1a interacting zinc finger protein 1b isoform X2 n=1 Tax=Alosa sapidissima TaxID=34773 RepID=UPI001C09AB80|nr:cdkn1a interacting zinc finger protein 1b isoform X2 [Alosa sapidissima]